MTTVLEGLIARELYSLRANVRVVSTTDLDNVGNGTWVTAMPSLTAGSAGTTTIDGVLLADGDRVLIKNQTVATENGIYEVSDASAGSPTVLTRTTDMFTGESASGSFVFAMAGTANAQTGWTVTNAIGSDVVNTASLVFKQFDVLNTLSVTRGGTGATTFTANGVVIGNGTSPLTTITAVNNAVLVTNGSGVPSWSTTLPTGLSASFYDETFNILDTADPTKILNFEVDTIATATTIVATIFPTSDTITGIASTQTLTNKTMTSDRYNLLNDTNGNESIILTATASAVNEITVANAATGTAPKISATGTDTNIALSFQAKGTGVYNFLSTSTLPTTIALYEDTDNGSNFIAIDVPASITANLTYTLPGTDGASGDYLTTDGSGNLSFTTPSSGRVAYHIVSYEIAVNKTAYTSVGVFSWNQSRYSTYTNGALIWEVVIGNRNCDIRLRDVTNVANVIEVLGVAASAFRVDTGFTNPVANGRLELQVKKSAAGGNNPEIHGVQLEWSPN